MNNNISMDMIEGAMWSQLDRRRRPEFTYSADVNPN